MKFEAGDVVRLKSGGPSMTLEKASGSGWSCVWFNNASGVHSYASGIFPLEMLEKPLPANGDPYQFGNERGQIGSNQPDSTRRSGS
jgi:uncharacterized protein YodC (DUF2158 family)